MILSMTGFGKAEVSLTDKRVHVEIRSLNSKNVDLQIRTPSYLSGLEIAIRKQLSEQLIRGKVDCSLSLHQWGEATAKINKDVVQEYVRQLKALPDADSADLLSIAMRLPESLSSDKKELPEEEQAHIMAAVQKASSDLQNHRAEEGEQIAVDFRQRLELLGEMLEAVQEMAPQRTEKVKEKLRLAFENATIKADSERFEQELIYYLEKSDITEECVRLNNHLNYFREVMEKETPNGKKLSFIAQEIGREVNTIGSKANHTEIQKTVVQMKDELEKIREQLMNVL